MQVAVLHHLLQALLLQQAVDERHHRRQRGVEDDAADGGVDDLVRDRLRLGLQHGLVVARDGQVDQLAGEPQADRRQRLDLARLERQHTSSTLPNTRPSPLAPARALVR